MKFFKCLFFLLLMILMLNAVNAQQKHFIYIQTADKQPFAVVMNGKVFSSSDYGYVIIPKLVDGSYNFTVSFPLNKYPDQKFDCVIDKKDVGFTLKNAGNTWTLLGAQKDNSVADVSSAVSTSTTNNNSKNNAFGDMLSQVANDSNLNAKNQPAPNKVDTVSSTNNSVTANTNTALPAATSAATNVSNMATAAVATNAALQKLSEEKQDTGTRMVFVDNTDTVKVFVPQTSIPNNATAINSDATNQQPTNNIATNTQQNVESATNNNVDTSSHNVSNPFYNQSSTQNTSANQTPVVNTPSTSDGIKNDSTTKASGTVKNDCSYTLTDNDVDKIKRKMFVQKNNYNMVQAAVRYLGEKCITTEQVKTLGNLFSSDDGRYTLYDALYKNTYDFGNYATLETQILDPYYKKRFETMIR